MTTRLLPWLAAVIVAVALWPAVCVSEESGPTSCDSLLLPLPWGDSADTWGWAAAIAAAVLTYFAIRGLLHWRQRSVDQSLTRF